jgi:hypothetical protein
MSNLGLLPIFLIGLLGSVHCVGMCGGIVAALSVAPGGRTVIPIRSINTVPSSASFGLAIPLEAWTRVLAYNAGRIGSYAAAGAIMGAVAGGALALTRIAALQTVAYVATNAMLMVLGLYLMDAWRGLAQIERIGQALWRRLQPMGRSLLPLDSPLKMLMMGALWGWLQCGMVYSVLLTATLSGSATGGAAVMLAFGLGTLPAVLAMGLSGQQLRIWMQRRAVRLACGLVIFAFGVLGVARAMHGQPVHWFDSLCIAPVGAGGYP